MNKLFSMYMYDPETGAFEGILKDVKESEWKLVADKLHYDHGYNVKVVDQFDGTVEFEFVL